MALLTCQGHWNGRETFSKLAYTNLDEVRTWLVEAGFCLNNANDLLQGDCAPCNIGYRHCAQEGTARLSLGLSLDPY
jgi:hypothetical protein